MEINPYIGDICRVLADEMAVIQDEVDINFGCLWMPTRGCRN